MAALITATLVTGAGPSQTISVVNELVHEPRYTSSRVGYGGTRSHAYELYHRLLQVAGDDELRDLLGHASPVVRLYAFQGLIARGFGAEPLIAELVATESFVDVQYGCSRSRERVGEIAKQIVEDHAARMN